MLEWYLKRFFKFKCTFFESRYLAGYQGPIVRNVYKIIYEKFWQAWLSFCANSFQIECKRKNKHPDNVLLRVFFLNNYKEKEVLLFILRKYISILIISFPVSISTSHNFTSGKEIHYLKTISRSFSMKNFAKNSFWSYRVIFF